MKSLIGLAVCLGLALALSGCGGKDESGSKSKSSSSPSPSGGPPSGPRGGPSGGPRGGPPSRGPGASSDSGDAPGDAQAKADAKPEPKPFDDHSDDPWYPGDVAKQPGGEGEKKPGAMASSWEPDKALLDQLEPYQDVEGYQIRLPKGFSATQLPFTPPQGTRLFFWLGPRQADGSASFVQVVLASLPPQETKANLETALADAADTLKAQQREWKQTPAETGQINGLPCLRVQNQGVVAQKKVRGFIYAAQDGSTLIMITGVSPADSAEALKLAEGAALTFRKK